MFIPRTNSQLNIEHGFLSSAFTFMPWYDGRSVLVDPIIFHNPEYYQKTLSDVSPTSGDTNRTIVNIACICQAFLSSFISKVK